MSKFIVSTHITAPREIVFAVLSDLAHTAENVSAIECVEILTAGPVGVGTRYRETRKMFGKTATEEFEITAFDPPHGYTVECDSCGAHYKTLHTLTPDVWGTTVEILFDCQATSLVAKLMSPLSLLMLGPMKKCIATHLADIKRVAEAQEHQPAEWIKME